MLTILPRKFVILLLFLFALASLGLWYTLSFSPPQNVQITDQTETSAVVVWNTVKPSTSNVYYSTSSVLLKFLPLTFLATSLARNHEQTINHRVVLTNLKPNQTYYLSISNWFHFYNTQRTTFTGINNGFWQRISGVSLPTIKISSSGRAEFIPSAIEGLARMTTILGIVANSRLQPTAHTLVIAKTASGQSYSALTDQKGNFSLNVSLTDKDAVFFLTSQNGVLQQKNIVISKDTINRPILIVLP